MSLISPIILLKTVQDWTWGIFRVGKSGFHGFCITRLFSDSLPNLSCCPPNCYQIYECLPNFTKVYQIWQIYQILPNFYQILTNFTKILPNLGFTQFFCDLKILVIHAFFFCQICIPKKSGLTKMAFSICGYFFVLNILKQKKKTKKHFFLL